MNSPFRKHSQTAPVFSVCNQRDYSEGQVPRATGSLWTPGYPVATSTFFHRGAQSVLPRKIYVDATLDATFQSYEIPSQEDLEQHPRHELH